MAACSGAGVRERWAVAVCGLACRFAGPVERWSLKCWSVVRLLLVMRLGLPQVDPKR
jgi:hypothetical protein